MDIKTINNKLLQGEIHDPGLFPRLERLKQIPFVFQIDFGLNTLPTEPGILLIRGARQYGKSTWLESRLRKTIQEFGPGSAFYLNGENILDPDQLELQIDQLLSLFPKSKYPKRIFIDEITAIPRWELALKRMADQGRLTHVLIITTGSKASDLRRGAERLPGRKGRLNRTNYFFTPISYNEFLKVSGTRLGDKTFLAYLLSGGSPIACSELIEHGKIPEFVIELTRDWIEGELAASGRSRISLINVLNTIIRFGGSPVGQAKLARESGLANNTVAAGYIELLNDLGCVIPTFPWDPGREILILRKPCKYHFSNLLAAVAYHPGNIRSIEDFLRLPEKDQGIWYEWVIAQELLRQNAIQGKNLLGPLAFWQDKNHEIDFVKTPTNWIEVKRGQSSPLDFSWFSRQHPKALLTIINTAEFRTDTLQGIPIQQFMLNS